MVRLLQGRDCHHPLIRPPLRSLFYFPFLKLFSYTVFFPSAKKRKYQLFFFQGQRYVFCLLIASSVYFLCPLPSPNSPSYLSLFPFSILFFSFLFFSFPLLFFGALPSISTSFFSSRGSCNPCSSLSSVNKYSEISLGLKILYFPPVTPCLILHFFSSPSLFSPFLFHPVHFRISSFSFLS